MHRVIENRGLDRLGPWLKGSVLVMGGFLLLRPMLAVVAAVAMMTVCGYRIAVVGRFLRGPLAIPEIRVGFAIFMICDIVGLLLGAGMIVAIEFGTADVRSIGWPAGSVAWMSTAVIGNVSIAVTSGRRLLHDESAIPGWIGLSAALVVGALGLAFVFIAALQGMASTVATWHPLLVLGGWLLGLLGLGIGFLAARFALDQMAEHLVADFVESRSASAEDMRTNSSDRASKDLSSIPLER